MHHETKENAFELDSVRWLVKHGEAQRREEKQTHSIQFTWLSWTIQGGSEGGGEINEKGSHTQALAKCKAVFHAVGQLQIQLSRKIVGELTKKYIKTHFKISKFDHLSQGPGR